jgi:tetratricopeptide (TPR) repeat protein
MSARTRVVAIVGVAAVLATAAVVGGTLLQTRGQSTVAAGAVSKPRSGYPPLQLELGVRADAEARALARGERLYGAHKVEQAATIFAGYRSLAARIGAAFAAWRRGDGLAAMQRLAAGHAGSSLAQLHLGWASYWAGRNADALAAWTRAERLEPDTPYAVDAEDALHPSDIPGLPPIVTGVQLPPTLRNLAAAQQLAALRRAAARRDVRAKLLYGVALWNLKRPLSAERELAAAARLAPGDPLVRTAAAVAAFTKAAPVRAFGRLGPLTGVFPKASVVRFHLGLLLLYVGERKKAVAQLRLAVADEPHTIYAKDADVLLGSLVKNGT